MSYHDFTGWRSTPNTRAPGLSVVIPTFNERIRLLPTIGAVATHASSVGMPWELIISDDGSTDGTPDLVRSLELPNTTVLSTAENRGKGDAVRRGVMAARGDFVLFTDADESTPIHQVDDLLSAVWLQGHDIAVGSRSHGSVQNRSRLRRAASAGLQMLVRHALRTNVVDTQCGFKLFQRDAARRVFDAQTIDGFSFDLEVLYLARRFGYSVAEIPVEWHDAPGSKVNSAREAKRFLADIARIRANERKGVYAAA
jgi:dolichyl-phosphate beta-glucosyltransferase